MGVGAKRRRKDLMYAKQIFELISYFFDGESAEEMDEFKLDEDMVIHSYICYEAYPYQRVHLTGSSSLLRMGTH